MAEAQERDKVVAIDLEAIQAPGVAKAGGHCATVTEVNGEMEVLFDKFVLPRLYERDSFQFVMSSCSDKNKRLAEQHGVAFDDAVKCIKDILRRSIVVDHDVDQDLNGLEITHSVPCCVYDTARCEALEITHSVPCCVYDTARCEALPYALTCTILVPPSRVHQVKGN